MHKTTWLGAAVLVLAACQSQETPDQMQARIQKESDSLRAVAGPISARWAGWVGAGQADSVASVFTDQGREMPPNQPAVVGRAAIKMFEARSAATFNAKLVITGDAYTANGPLGVERGSYTYEGKAKPGAPKGTPAVMNDQGKYLIHWQNVGGQWQIAELIWNGNAPMVMPAPPKKAASHPAAKGAKKTKKR
jgi:ketosteroid isomerase-like protein